jgi:hypothetical protein
MHVVDGELEWFTQLELALEFRGAWDLSVRQPPPCPVLCAECRDAPLSMEAYAVDPDHFRNGEEVAFDLVHSRFDPVESESCVASGAGWQVQATGVEIDLPTQLAAYIVYANDAWYVLAFSSWEGQLDDEMWRVHAMTATAQFGKHKAYGHGVDGLVNLVGHHLADAGVQFGRSRSHMGFTRAQSTVRRGRPKGWTDERPPIPETDEDVPAETITQEEPATVDADPLGPLDDELAAFDSKLRSRIDGALPEPEPAWPRPWQPLPNVQPPRETADFRQREGVRAQRVGRTAREQEVREFADGLPAEVALYAEKIHGVRAAFGHRELLAFPVVGLDRIPVAFEAALRMRQGELQASDALAMGPPRRSPSTLGRDVAEGMGVTVDAALRAVFRDDDRTAYDLLGWQLGWRDVQARLPAFGLTHHSTLVPARARVLAFCDLDGPFQGMAFSDRVEMWRGLDEDGRRGVIGQLHKTHAALPLADVESAWLDACHAPDPDRSRARWSAALGPRGCAMEYAQLVAALLRNEVLGMAWAERLQSYMKPCAGDHLSGAVAGVEMIGGKLGQSFGALNGAGWLGPMSGGDVAMCILARRIETDDHAALAEQLRLLSGLLYRLVAS